MLRGEGHSSIRLKVLAGLALATLLLVALSLGMRATNVKAPALSPVQACSSPASGPGRVLHVDPLRGSASGDGSRERPWRDLNQLVDDGLLGESERHVGLVDRLAARLLARPPGVKLRERPKAIVRAGDTLSLASGSYGDVDLSGLVNSGFVTIMAASGARPHFTSLNLAQASHFIVKGISVSAPSAPARAGHLVTTYRPGPIRADNIVLDALDVRSTLPIRTADPADFASQAPGGVILEGDCLTLRRSRVHDVSSGVAIVRGRQVLIAENHIFDMSVDGIQFSGWGIAIRANLISDHWATTDPLHPDCMQGQPQGTQVFGPVSITGNACIRRFSKTASQGPELPDRFGWQGISIFDGRWRDVTVSCNLVLPAAQHGIALYGVDGALIERNVVIGTAKGPSWIAVLPSKEGRQSTQAVIRNNRATAYLNAVHGAPLPNETMINILKVNRRDEDLVDVLRSPILGVELSQNAWQLEEMPDRAIFDDARFTWVSGVGNINPIDAREAQRMHPLPASCR